MSLPTIETQIREKLASKLHPIYLDVVNESAMHRVPPNSQTHFKVVVVADLFEGKPLIQRHRMVNKILQIELEQYIHALGLHLYTRTEWNSLEQQPISPPCANKTK